MHKFVLFFVTVVMSLTAAAQERELKIDLRFSPSIKRMGYVEWPKLDFRPPSAWGWIESSLSLSRARLDFAVPRSTSSFTLIGSSRFDTGKLSLGELARNFRFTAQSSNYSAFRMEGWRITEKGAEIWIKIGG